MRVVVGEDSVLVCRDFVVRYYPLAGPGVAHELGNACGFDTEEKWVEIIPLMPGNKAMTAAARRQGRHRPRQGLHRLRRGQQGHGRDSWCELY